MTNLNNEISIGLGLLAWALPLICLLVRKRRELFCCGSIACVMLSLYFQIREITRLADAHAFAAIEDLINGIHFCAAVLIAVTLVLNAITLLRKEK